MIRRLREDEIEIDAAAQLMRVAYGREAPYVARLRRYLAIEPEGWFVLEEGGAFIGVVGMTLHGSSVGYVGLMAIRPDVQGRKLGRALMEHALAWARSRGVPRVMLDASEAGYPLYLRLGFEERGRTFDAVLDKTHDSPIERGSLDEVLELDRVHFGVDRSATLRTFAAAFPERLVVARAKGRVTGYAIAQDALIGPVIAEDEASARAVIAAAASLPFAAPPRIIGPEEHEPLVASLGFRTTRHVRHMRLGAPELPYRVIGKASMALG